MPVLPLGLGCVASATQKFGHDIQLLNLMAHEDVHKILEKSIKAFQPEAIGISVRNIDNQVMASPKFLLEPVKSIISFCREYTDCPIILGGAGYSIFPQSALEYLKADMGIQGQGESAFVHLLERLQSRLDLSGLPGLYLPQKGLQGKRDVVVKLDDFPMPLPGEHINIPPNLQNQEIWLPFQTRRGCPMQCSYCSTAVIEGQIIQKRELEHAVKVLSKYSKAGFDHFFFVDNTFNLPLSYAKHFCDKIIEEGLNISWRCILYPWKIDEELVEKMAVAGCAEVSLGFESGSTQILHNMNKKYSPEEVRIISETLKKYKLKQTGFLLLGGPGETSKTALESLEYANSLNLELMKVTTGIRIYPHTMLAHKAVKEGLIKNDEDLLFPTFYMSKGLGQWLAETVNKWLSDRPNWFQ
jgi:radical SAM superfamily enzyme YgiQ (UPF0313 family)